MDARDTTRRVYAQLRQSFDKQHEADLAFARVDLEQRVQRKRDERAAYALAVSARKWREEAAITGDAGPSATYT